MENEIKEYTTTNFVGVIEVAGVEIPCAVLYPTSDNPKRVIVQRELVHLLTGTRKGGFERYLKPKNLKPYLPKKFKNKPLSESVLTFRYKGRLAQAFEGADIIDLCQMYLRARLDGKLLDTQISIARKAEAIISAFAKTGITAVIDEATNYQEVRDRKALQKMLDKYLLADYAKWAKRFPDEFYEQMFRLKGWQWPGMKVNRPSIVGKYTNDLVYERLAPGILEELRRRNPPDEKGQRKSKLHQWLTPNIGHPALQRHLAMLIGFERASANWGAFYRLVQRALPKQNEQIPLAIEE